MEIYQLSIDFFINLYWPYDSLHKESTEYRDLHIQ